MKMEMERSERKEGVLTKPEEPASGEEGLSVFVSISPPSPHKQRHRRTRHLKCAPSLHLRLHKEQRRRKRRKKKKKKEGKEKKTLSET